MKPVGGPGSPGVLFVEGERFNVNRYYAPPAAPIITPQPGDVVTYDAYGMPMIKRPIGLISSGQKQGVPGSKTLVRETDVIGYEEISTGQLMAEAQRGAVMAEAQLENDVKAIKAINLERQQFNNLVMAVAKDATGKDRGTTPKEWRDALAAGNNSSKTPTKTPEKPTLSEVVALVYNPVFAPIAFMGEKTTRYFVDT